MIKYDYIAIEGVIGAGKTALSSLLAKKYNAHLIQESFEENSFLPKFYKEPDKYAFPLEMSFMASRFQQLKDDLQKRDLFKSFIISDYIFEKSLIFAKVTLQEDEFKLFSRFFGFINVKLPRPDLLIYLYLSPEKLKQNIKKRGRSYEQEIQIKYLEDLQKTYLSFLNQRKDLKIILLDTNQLDFVGRHQDFLKVEELLKQDYAAGINRITL